MLIPSPERKRTAMASMGASYHCMSNSYEPSLLFCTYLVFPMTTETLVQTPDLMLQKAKLLW